MQDQPLGAGIYKPKQTSFAQFIWNSDKGEFLGRTGTSWAKIGLFYLIFYTCLALFFSGMLAVFYQTLDTENRPTYTPGPGGSLLRNPALGFRPRPRAENVESTLIWYNNGNKEDIKHWVNELTTFISDYEGTDDDGQHIKECSFATYKEEQRKIAEGGERDNRACKFQDTQLGGYCHKGEDWGYTRDAPCVLLKLNRMIDWIPDVYKTLEELPTNMPKMLREKIENDTRESGEMKPMVWVSCEGENPADKEYLPKIELSPYYGFPAYYFPYTKIPGYRSPLVAVSFINPEPNVLINVECRVWTKNIHHERSNRLGLVHFELLRD